MSNPPPLPPRPGHPAAEVVTGRALVGTASPAQLQAVNQWRAAHARRLASRSGPAPRKDQR